MNRTYLCIDFKTFYASVECVARNLDPFTTNLVVADPTRGKGAICLAITPKMKAQGIKNRCRIFEIPEGVTYITALPRMKLYMQTAADIYAIYLRYIAKEDIHVYSIDEAFLDVTNYLKMYQLTAKQLAIKILDDIYTHTRIPATVGMGTNLYLAKVALDISAKHTPDHMSYLNEQLYQETLWHHQPLTDFWHVGRGTVKRLAKYGINDMYDIAHCPQDILYKELGINAEYLIDHAWGKEPTTIAEIKQYRPKSNSLSNNQILFEDYCAQDAYLVLKEMVEMNVLELIAAHLVTDCIGISIGYASDHVKSTGGMMKLSQRTNSHQYLWKHFKALYQKTTNTAEMIRSIGISFGNVMPEIYESFDLFSDHEALQEEKALQETLVEIKQKYGKNAIIKGMNLLDKATAIKRNKLVGGHNAE